MKVFLSSLIGGFEEIRDAAALGVSTLGHKPVRAEDFGASPDSPQQACLAGVRDADVLVLILGDRYGYPQASGLSATHEEYREARDSKPVLVFIKTGASPEADQASFIAEVQGWERGHFTSDFDGPDDLRTNVTRALHDHVLANEAAPLDESQLVERARALLPTSRGSGTSAIAFALSTGPERAVLRPAELEDAELRRFLPREALTGDDAVLSTSIGTTDSIRGDAIHLVQENGRGSVMLDESGSLLVVQPIVDDGARFSGGIPSIIEETVTERISRAIRFSARVLDRIDDVRRITHVAPVVALFGGGHLVWRTQAEHDRSPNSATMSMHSNESVVVALSPPVKRRPSLSHETHQLAEDFTVRLRREVRR